MDFKVFFSDEALNDLGEIVEWIARDNPDAASRVGQAILEHVRTLEHFPQIGTFVPRRRKIRKLVHAPYVIYYRMDENRRWVEIVHIWHGKRRPRM